jgi:hypothetical protein
MHEDTRWIATCSRITYIQAKQPAKLHECVLGGPDTFCCLIHSILKRHSIRFAMHLCLRCTCPGRVKATRFASICCVRKGGIQTPMAPVWVHML